MGKLSRYVFVGFALVAALVGCRRETSVVPGRIVTNEVDCAYADLPDDAVIVAIGNQVYRKADLETDSQPIRQMIRKGSRSDKAAAAEFAKNASRIRSSLVMEFVSSSSFYLEAQARNVEAEQEDFDISMSCRSNLLTRMGMSESEMENKFSGLVARLNEKMEREAVNRALFRILFTNALEVTDAEVDKLHAELQQLNEASAKTNELIFAKVAALRTKFCQTQPKFGDDEDENAKLLPEGFSASCFDHAPANSFDSPNAVVTLQKTAKGMWSEPIELEDEIAIFYLRGIEPNSVDHPALYSGIKVSTGKDLGYLVPEKAALKSDLRKGRNEQIVIPRCQEIQRKFGVRYPHGFVWIEPKNRQGIKRGDK